MTVPELLTVNFTLPAGADDGVTVIVIAPFVPAVSPTSTATGVAAAAPALPAPMLTTPALSAAMIATAANARARLLVVDVLVRLT